MADEKERIVEEKEEGYVSEWDSTDALTEDAIHAQAEQHATFGAEPEFDPDEELQPHFIAGLPDTAEVDTAASPAIFTRHDVNPNAEIDTALRVLYNRALSLEERQLAHRKADAYVHLIEDQELIDEWAEVSNQLNDAVALAETEEDDQDRPEYDANQIVKGVLRQFVNDPNNTRTTLALAHLDSVSPRIREAWDGVLHRHVTTHTLTGIPDSLQGAASIIPEGNNATVVIPSGVGSFAAAEEDETKAAQRIEADTKIKAILVDLYKDNLSLEEKQAVQEEAERLHEPYIGPDVRKLWVRATNRLRSIVRQQERELEQEWEENDPQSKTYRANQRLKKAIADHTEGLYVDFNSLSGDARRATTRLYSEWRSLLDAQIDRQSTTSSMLLERALIAMESDWTAARDRIVSYAQANRRDSDPATRNEFRDAMQEWRGKRPEMPVYPKLIKDPKETYDRAAPIWEKDLDTGRNYIVWQLKEPESKEEAREWKKQDTQYIKDIKARERALKKYEKDRTQFLIQSDGLVRRDLSGVGIRGDGQEGIDYILEDASDVARHYTPVEKVERPESPAQADVVGDGSTERIAGLAPAIFPDEIELPSIVEKANTAIYRANETRSSSDIDATVPHMQAAINRLNVFIQRPLAGNATQIEKDKRAIWLTTLDQFTRQVDIIDRQRTTREEDTEYRWARPELRTGLAPIIHREANLQAATKKANEAIVHANETQKPEDMAATVAPMREAVDALSDYFFDADMLDAPQRTRIAWNNAIAQFKEQIERIEAQQTPAQLTAARIAYFAEEEASEKERKRLAKEAKEQARALQGAMDFGGSPDETETEIEEEATPVSMMAQWRVEQLKRKADDKAARDRTARGEAKRSATFNAAIERERFRHEKASLERTHKTLSQKASPDGVFSPTDEQQKTLDDLDEKIAALNANIAADMEGTVLGMRRGSVAMADDYETLLREPELPGFVDVEGNTVGFVAEVASRKQRRKTKTRGESEHDVGQTPFNMGAMSGGSTGVPRAKHTRQAPQAQTPTQQQNFDMAGGKSGSAPRPPQAQKPSFSKGSRGKTKGTKVPRPPGAGRKLF